MPDRWGGPMVAAMRMQPWRSALRGRVRRSSGNAAPRVPRRDGGGPSEQARHEAVKAVATVVAEHLRDENSNPRLRRDSAVPLIVHVDGVGKSTFLETLSSRLDYGARSSDAGSWTTIRFDA